MVGGVSGSSPVGARAALRLGLALAALAAAAEAPAASFGIPTRLSADGQVCTGLNAPVAGCPGAAVDPAGYFILTGTGANVNLGDAVHQLRLFVEVTGDTLDVKVFDAGDTGARDTAGGSSTQYQLLTCPAYPACAGATVLRTVTLVSDVAGLTQDRLARFSSTGAAVFTTANTGTVFTGLTPGLYEFRVTMTAGGTSENAFGVEVTDQAGGPYNAFTIGRTAAPDTSFIGGARSGGGATITQPMTFFAYVDRGCALETSNFDGDSVVSASLTDVLGSATALTVSGQANRADDLVTVEDGSVTNQQSLNYGMYTLANDTGQNNIVDWRIADFTGWTDTASPRNPANPIRTYLPNGYDPATAAVAAVPAEPILQSGFAVLSGQNPPVVGLSTRYLVTATVINPAGAPGPLTGLVLRVPVAPGTTPVPGTPAATIDGLPATCSEAGGGGSPVLVAGTSAVQCTFTAPVPVDGVASITLQVDYTPGATGLINVTGHPILSVTSLTRGGGTATAVTAFPHWLQVGDQVTIAGVTNVGSFNGTFTVTSVPDPTTFTYALGGFGATATGTITATQAGTLDATVNASYGSAFNTTETLGPVCQLVAEVQNSADISVTKSDSPDPVSAGNLLTYTIAVANAGPNPATNAALADALPAGTTFQSLGVAGAGAGGWTCATPAVGANGTVQCVNGSVPTGAGGNTTFTLVVRVGAGTAPGTLSNTATVTSGAADPVPGNNSATAQTTVVASADLSITKIDDPDPVQPGRDLTYTITVTNLGPSNAASLVLGESVPANTTFQAIALPSGWTCPTLPAVNGTGAISCQGPGLAAGASARVNLLVRVTGGATITNTATISAATPDPAAGNNTTGPVTTTVTALSVVPSCATGVLGPGGTLGGVVNTYYPGTATAAAGATSITLGAATGAATAIAAGDLVLVVQMQDAAIDSTNTSSYGDGTAGGGAGSTAVNNSGRYEYVVATNAVPLAGGTLTIASGLSVTYTNAAAGGAQGQRRFQVVRVPQYANATLGSALTAGRWNGSSGGILAFDVTGNLALGGATVNVSGLGFRAGQGRGLAGDGTATDTDYRNLATLDVHAPKGEGIAGTPRFVYSTVGGAENTGVEGYPNGSHARGAPGNAGGGGTDGNVGANDENTGGGGGANGGAGGQGGNAWRSQEPVGGVGGAAFAASANRLALGGGGGAGTRNNSAGVQSSGGAGGALVMIRTSTVSGTGTITTDGQQGVTPDNDGGGGGGAGGSVLFLARGSALGGLTVNARGGRGDDAWPTQAPGGTPGERHGPGGGGGGGWVVVSGAPTAISVVGGANGITTTANDAFGAQPGSPGQSSTTLTDGAIPASCPVTDVSIVKDDAPDPVPAGQTVTYTITVRSAYDSNDVVVTDSLPATLAFVSARTTRGTCSFSSPTLTCALGNLQNGDLVTIEVVATALVTAVPSVTNTASVTTTSSDIVAGNDSDSETTTVTPAADVAVAKSGLPDPVFAGQDLTYAITVTNNGPSPAATVTLNDTVPANTTFQSITPPGGWTCGTVPVVGGTGPIACSTGSLAAGASGAFTLVVRVNAGAAPGSLISNTATVVRPAGEDLVQSNNSATAVTPVNASVVLLTRATIRGVRVDRSGRVEFATGTQRGTASFNLYATDDPAGTRRLLLNDRPIMAPVPDSPVPILYDVRTRPVTTRFLLVEETDRRGRRHLMGPFVVGDARLAAAFARVEKRMQAAGERAVRAEGAERARQLAPREEVPSARRGFTRSGPRERRGSSTPRDGVKIEVSRPGEVVVARAELEAAGLPPAVPLRRLAVSRQGSPVPSRVVGTGLGEAVAFRAEGLSTTYTGRSVYVVTWSGLPGMKVPLTFDGEPPPPGWTRVNKRRIYAADMPPGVDPWQWDVLFADWPWPDPGWDPEAGTFDLAGLAGGATAAPARVQVTGASDHVHLVEAWLNGQLVGSARLEGRSTAVIEGTGQGLQATGNRLSMTYRTEDGSWDGLVLLGHLDLGVPPVPANGPAVVEDVAPYDGSLPDLTRATYLIVTHAAFAAPAERLAALKTAEGHRAVVVDVERAYDRFSAGIVEAEAVAALLRHAARGGRLRHVLLLGDDTYDPQGFSGLPEVSWVPSLYARDGDFGRVPSENRYADLDGDGRPELAIGRLPARTGEEAEALVSKVAGQAAVLAAAAGRHLLVADNQAPGEVSFAAEARALAARLPVGSAVASVELDQGPDVARAALAAGLAAGPSVVHYFGHGGPEVWADEGLLAVEDVAALGGSGSVVLTWACQVQDYQYIFGRSVNEALVVKPEGGALASFGPAGIADAAAQAAFYERLYDTLLARRVTLGEAIRRAKAAAVAADPRTREVVESWNLLGDPSLVIEGLGSVPEGRR